jgi:hypothetical protein
LGLSEQGQRVIHDLPTQVQALIGTLDGVLDICPLLPDSVDLAAELVLGPMPRRLF